MASLWALLSAPDATAAYQRLCQLARGLGADDPHGMDARRADLLVELLTGRRCAATGDCPADCDGDCHDAPTGDTSTEVGAAVGATDGGSAADDCGQAAGPGKPLVSVIVPITMLLAASRPTGRLPAAGSPIVSGVDGRDRNRRARAARGRRQRPGRSCRQG